VLRRFLLRSLVLVGILLACFAHLVWNGWHARKIVAENQPHPLLSTGKRDVDLWAPSYEFGRVYDLTFLRDEPGPDSVPADARLKIQLASNGKTRLLVVREGHPNVNATWWDVLLRREKLQMVADREWIDLGPAPRPGEPLDVQVQGLLPGPFGFAQLFARERPHFARLRVVRPDSPRARVTNTTLRYRFENAAPVAARETLARFFFFVSCSRVLQVTAVFAFALLFAGWWWFWEKSYTHAVAALVPAVTLIHACCLPPFQGADAINHIGTVEAAIFNPSLFGGPWAYPKSLATVYDAIGYDSFVRHPDVPIPLTSPGLRDAARDVIARPALAEAH
jgi:hypothetical protein